MIASQLRNAAVSLVLRRYRAAIPEQSIRKFSILQDFSKKLKGEIDSNPELKKSIKELKEKAEGLKCRTKETAEHLYKHAGAARGEAETRVKQVSSVIKEKISEATEQVKESVHSVNLQSDKANEKPTEEVKQEESVKPDTEEVKGHTEETKEKGEQTGNKETENKATESVASKITSCVSNAFKALEKGKLAAVARDGYNILAEELTSKRRVKNRPSFTRSEATAVVPVVKHKTGWQKRWEELKEKASSHPALKRFKTVKEHPVVVKSHEIAEDIRERWETSDSPVVHKIQDLNDSLFGETATATAMREIRNKDPTFSFPEFVMEVQEDVRPVLTAYLKGDLISLRKKCSREVVERCRAEQKALRSQGLYVDTKILFVSDVEVKETKLMGTIPIIIVSFQSQQNYCVRDESGKIKEGSKDDIRTVYYFWAMQPVPDDELDPNDCTPRWQLREMQQLGVRAII